jgi:proteasome beta subunit
MATIVGIECADGVLLAGDRTLTTDGTVRSTDKRHVFDYGAVGAAAAGEAGALDTFSRELAAEIREYRTERSVPVRIDPLARMASSLSASTGTEALVAAPDAGGAPRLRVVYADGSVVDDDRGALGSGAALALGQLDAAGEVTLAGAADLVDDLFAAVAERDPGTGTDVDVYRLAAED